MSEGQDGWGVERAHLTAGSALLVVAMFVAATTARNLLEAAHRTIGWVVASAVAAMLLAPLVDLLARRMRRGLAIALTMLATIVLASTVVAGVLADLNQQVERLKDDLPEAAAAIENDQGGTGESAREFELRARVESFVDGLDDSVSQRAAAEDALSTVPAYFLNAVLVVFFLVFGVRTGQALVRQLSDVERRDRYAAVVSEAIGNGQRYILGSLGQAAVAGVVTGLVAWELALPAPAVLGVVMTAMALVPYLGVLLGSVPLLLLSGGFEAGWVTALLALGAVALQAVSVVAMRWVAARSLRVGPAVVVIVAFVGFGVYGFGGAFIGTALAVFGVAALDVATKAPVASPPTLTRG